MPQKHEIQLYYGGIKKNIAIFFKAFYKTKTKIGDALIE